MSEKTAPPIWCEIVCADCATTISGTFTCGDIPRLWMNATAKKLGWKFTDDWRCKRCARAALTANEKET